MTGIILFLISSSRLRGIPIYSDAKYGNLRLKKKVLCISLGNSTDVFSHV